MPCQPYLTPALSAPMGRRGRDPRSRGASWGCRDAAIPRAFAVPSLRGLIVAGLVAISVLQVSPARCAVYYDLPEVNTPLQPDNGKPRQVRLRMALELRQESDRPLIEKAAPAIADSVRTVLARAHSAQLMGRVGLDWLREQMLARISADTPSIAVTDLLFQELMIQ